ncbi:MAG: MFS transporter [Spirochaetia bacterium]|jgi:EmrB/QacA subfamily drug resistance transporter
MKEHVAENAGPWVLFSTIFASSMAFIDATALNVSLPAVQAGLHASAVQLLWIVNAYLLMLAALIPVGGSLGDLLGRRKVFAVGIGLFMLASLVCGLAPSADFLIWARVLQGIGSAMMIPGSLAIISSFFGPSERGRAIGTWSAATTIVTVIGPILGGVLSSAGLWRGVFLINLPLGVAALIPLFLRVPESRNEQSGGRIDFPGAGLLVVALAGLTWGFISAPDAGFADSRVIVALAVGVAALAGFLVVEARSRYPMIPLVLFTSRTFSGTNLLTLALYGALSVGMLFLSLNLVQAQGYSMALAGFAFTPFALVLTALSRWAGGLVDRSGPRLPLMIGPAIAGAAFLSMAWSGLTLGPSRYWLTFFPGVVLLGVGMGITVAPLTTAVMSSVASHLSGTASGINNAVSRTAGVLAIAVVGALSLVLFAHGLDARAAGAGLPDPVRQALSLEAGRLGAAAVPREVAAQDVGTVQSVIRLAFVDTFKFVMLVCAALSWVGAGLAGLFVERNFKAAK